jgi:cell cycle sensor histidine kinase DivJ
MHGAGRKTVINRRTDLARNVVEPTVASASVFSFSEIAAKKLRRFCTSASDDFSMRAIAVPATAETMRAPSGAFAAAGFVWTAFAAGFGAVTANAGAGAGAALAISLLVGAPGLAMAALAPHRSAPWARAYATFAWTAFAILATALSGGAASPASVSFLIAPAFAWACGDRRGCGEAIGFAVVGWALAAAGFSGDAMPLTGSAPVALAVAAALFAGWLALAVPRMETTSRATARRPAPGSVLLDPAGRVVEADALVRRRLNWESDGVGRTLPDLVARAAGAQAADAVRLATARALAGEIARADVPIGETTQAIEVHPAPGGAVALIVDVGDLAGRLAALERDAAKSKEARAARSRQTAELSHELHTPLTHILGFTEILQRELYGPLAPKYHEYVGLIQTSGRNLLDLIGGLMDLSRLDGGRYAIDPERFDARDILAEVVRLSSEAAARKGVALTADCADEAIEVDADPRALRQMIVNITSNGVKFTPGGGSVVVAARAEDGALVIEASDTGPGIAPEDRVRLGQAFERGTGVKAVEGIGLGLALTRAFAELHGGALSFHDAPGGGALVRITLPVLARPRPGM